MCFANTPLWSANGKWILFSCEAGGFISNVGGTTLRTLNIGTDERPWAVAIGWVGTNCVLYVQALDGNRDDTYEARLLNLKTSETQEASAALPMLQGTVAGLMEASAAAKVRRTTSGIEIKTNLKTWTLSKGSHADVVGGWTTGALPRDCE